MTGRTPRPTLRDIAQATGLSPSTVSRALRGSSRISPATRQLVTREASRLGYQVDLAASLLRSGRARNVGLLCRLDQELHFAYYRCLLGAAERAGIRLVVESVSQARPASQALGVLEQLRCRALVVIDPAGLDGLDVSSLAMPTVIIGQGPCEQADLVTSDNTTGMAQLAEHLRQAGHRQVAYLDGPSGRSATARRHAFLTAATRSGLEVELRPAGSCTDDGYTQTRAMMEAGQLTPADSAVAGRVSALVCYNDQCAQGAVVALLRGGLRPGWDVAVSGCDNSRIASCQAFDLTSIDRRPEQVAALAVELAAARLEPGGGDGVDHRQVPATVSRKVATQLVVRGSTSRVRLPPASQRVLGD
ncbi:LacI family DNA-binding transcriptional regulator [Actinomyces faecalis]|uniref:LacI family DNA-binding transcriptional regulator n=1 Tax=Actinomyces faecalis TaxID=2722820 RepID=UPI0015556787|nr:LacI family DNA-binding transcriptional regulator [Actinomyces faecalis]